MTTKPDKRLICTYSVRCSARLARLLGASFGEYRGPDQFHWAQGELFFSTVTHV
jgi:hypothetical protein